MTDKPLAHIDFFEINEFMLIVDELRKSADTPHWWATVGKLKNYINTNFISREEAGLND